MPLWTLAYEGSPKSCPVVKLTIMICYRVREVTSARSASARLMTLLKKNGTKVIKYQEDVLSAWRVLCSDIRLASD